jgi:inosine-uridine nucleoside N-ribohydrolase
MPGTDSQLAKPATRIIIDTDPGIDDAAAILLALASPEVTVLGLTAAAGNVGLAKTVANSLRILELAGIDNVPVAVGAGRQRRRRRRVQYVDRSRGRRASIRQRNSDHAVSARYHSPSCPVRCRGR